MFLQDMPANFVKLLGLMPGVIEKLVKVSCQFSLSSILGIDVCARYSNERDPRQLIVDEWTCLKEICKCL